MTNHGCLCKVGDSAVTNVYLLCGGRRNNSHGGVGRIEVMTCHPPPVSAAIYQYYMIITITAMEIDWPALPPVAMTQSCPINQHHVIIGFLPSLFEIMLINAAC